MPFVPKIPPKKLPIDLAVVDTIKGKWLIAIDSVVETQAGRNLLISAILEQGIDEERFRSRKLGITVQSLLARDPNSSYLLGRIQKWIETTEGDGALDETDLHI